MGFLSSLFGGDPRKHLEKAEGFLAAGRPDRAVEAARKALSADDETVAEAAREVIRQARTSLIEKALDMASTAEESEFWQDAVEWLDRALEQIEDDAQEAEITARREALVAKIEAEEEEVWQEPEPERADDEPAGGDLGSEELFLTLVDMLDDEVGRRYAAQDEAFREAYLSLNDGRVKEALPALDELVASRPDEPVLRFERGRGRLSIGDAAGAREDLEKALEHWDDIYLDRAGTLSVLAFWAEAMLELKEPLPVLERLEKAARPSNGQPELSLPYGVALVEAGHFEPAEVFLVESMSAFPSKPDFGLLLARLLDRRDRRRDAIQCLEMSIAPSCASGCSGPPRHLPSFRALVSLMLGVEEEESEKVRETRLDRVAELLSFIREGQGGVVTRGDALMHAELHRQRGNQAEAETWRARAEEASEQGEQLETVAMQAPKMSAETPI